MKTKKWMVSVFFRKIPTWVHVSTEHESQELYTLLTKKMNTHGSKCFQDIILDNGHKVIIRLDEIVYMTLKVSHFYDGQCRPNPII